MNATRKTVLMLLLSTVLASGAWLVHHRRASAAMVRVGGMGNACACTHRIEP